MSTLNIAPRWRLRAFILVVGALSGANALFLVQLVVANQDKTSLESAQQLALDYLAADAPDLASLGIESIHAQTEMDAAIASRAARVADWRVVQMLNEIAKESGVTLEFGGTLPSKSVEMGGREYVAVPVSLGATGSFPDLLVYLAQLQKRLVTLELEKVNVTAANDLHTMVVKASAYWEPELALPIQTDQNISASGTGSANPVQVVSSAK